jgi:para-nitrobenzyl esterase
MTDSIVRTTQGRVEGVTADTPSGPVTAFLGIPYARPPLGDLRFRAPVAATPWEGVRPATAFGPSPVQAAEGMLGGAVPGMAVGDVSEDCLTVNVWVPAGDAGPRAVLAWVYGGAFVIGGSALATYDGARLAAEQGVVVASFNYRVGALGFLDLRRFGGEAAGTLTNVGLRDQLLALRWIVDNAANFGGDPEKVTVFGESAGAGSILHLVTSPHHRGAMRRAIPQSPGVDFTQDADVAGAVAGRLLDKLGLSSAAELRDVPADAILKAQEDTSMELLVEYGSMVFHPVVDGDVVAATPSIAFARGDAADVDLLIGSTVHELRLFPDLRADDLTVPALAAWTRSYLQARMATDPPEGVPEALLQAYLDRAAGTPRPRQSDAWAALQTDGGMRLPAERIAEAQSAHNPVTYAYHFAWEAHHPERDMGAFHAIDLPFVFDTFDREGWDAFLGIDDDGRAVGRMMRSAWAAFARSGDPSSPEIGDWPRFDVDRRATMILDAKPAVALDPLAVERDLWDGLWDERCRPAAVPM